MTSAWPALLKPSMLFSPENFRNQLILCQNISCRLCVSIHSSTYIHWHKKCQRPRYEFINSYQVSSKCRLNLDCCHFLPWFSSILSIRRESDDLRNRLSCRSHINCRLSHCSSGGNCNRVSIIILLILHIGQFHLFRLRTRWQCGRLKRGRLGFRVFLLSRPFLF